MKNNDLFLKETDEIVELLDIYTCKDPFELSDRLLEFINKKQTFVKELNKKGREEFCYAKYEI